MARPRAAAAKPNVTYNRQDPSYQTVDPRWLVKVIALTVLAAFVCAYLAMCFLFWQGAWQLVLHPGRNVTAHTGLPSETVHFGPDEGGQSQLTGEFLPAAGSNQATPVVLYLRPGDGQLDQHDAPLMMMFHELGLNVLAFDYRGYGRSAQKPHPSEERMLQDAESAWNYLTGLRSVPANHVLIYGAGVGASLASGLTEQHPDAAALVLRNATADVTGTVKREPRSRVFPISLLFHDTFRLEGLKQLRLPKLLFDVGPADVGPEEQARQQLYRSAALPKMTVELPSSDPAAEKQALKRFLDSRAGLLPPAVLLPQLPSGK